jgi:hypothetical protein
VREALLSRIARAEGEPAITPLFHAPKEPRDPKRPAGDSSGKVP